jgi:hypothetical protein
LNKTREKKQKECTAKYINEVRERKLLTLMNACYIHSAMISIKYSGETLMNYFDMNMEYSNYLNFYGVRNAMKYEVKV